MIYELHVRDFSINDQTVPEASRQVPGLHRARLQRHETFESAGRRRTDPYSSDARLRFHLDQRRPSAATEPIPAKLAALPARLRSAAGADEPLRDKDGFNWGYDPYPLQHARRQLRHEPGRHGAHQEFRKMVRRSTGSGLRVVMDVVYNHTAASGQDPHSVPGSNRAGLLSSPRRGRARVRPAPAAEHGHRTRHDAKADDRLAGQLGDGSTKWTASAST